MYVLYVLRLVVAVLSLLEYIVCRLNACTPNPVARPNATKVRLPVRIVAQSGVAR